MNEADASAAAEPMKIAFALEYSLGHITHSDNLKRFLSGESGVDPVYIDIPFDTTPMPGILRPLFKDNWSIRASLAARRGAAAAEKVDAYFFHTQVTSLFSADLMRRAPSIISLDATPLQYDALGDFYKHRPAHPAVEAIKRKMNERAFAAATHLVTWSQWAKDSLVRDYGVDTAKVSVIAPGIDPELWHVCRDESTFARAKDGLTLLFVGADFERKGGGVLLKAFRKLRSTDPKVKLLIATKTLPPGELEPGVCVFTGLTPNSPGLRALYAQADVFAFPTLGDCLPLAVMEALAAGLPVVTSSVGALAEAVTHGVSGYVVDPGQPDEFYRALALIHGQIDSLPALSRSAAEQAAGKFDATTNYRRLIALIRSLAQR